MNNDDLNVLQDHLEVAHQAADHFVRVGEAMEKAVTLERLSRMNPLALWISGQSLDLALRCITDAMNVFSGRFEEEVTAMEDDLADAWGPVHLEIRHWSPADRIGNGFVMLKGGTVRCAWEVTNGALDVGGRGSRDVTDRMRIDITGALQGLSLIQNATQAPDEEAS